MLDRLEAPDRPVELLALLRVVGRELLRHLGDPEQLTRRERGAFEAEPLHQRGVAHALALRQRCDVEDRGERVERCAGRPRRDPLRVDAVDPVPAQHDQRVELVEVLDEHGVVAGPQLLDPAHDRLARRRALHEVGGEMGPRERAWHEPAPELREYDHRIGAAEPHAARGLALAQREHAHLGELPPQLAVEALLLELAQRVDRDAPGAERADAGAQRLLIFAELKVHRIL